MSIYHIIVPLFRTNTIQVWMKRKEFTLLPWSEILRRRDTSYFLSMQRCIMGKKAVLQTSSSRKMRKIFVLLFMCKKVKNRINLVYSDGEEGFNGIWSSTNMAEIKGDPSKNINYKVTTSVIYELKYTDENKNETSFSGNIKKIVNSMN